MEFSTIGFLGIYRFEDGAAIRGAVLATDLDTKPIEFRVTASVRPQKFQETLFGELLNEHLAIELMGIPLIKSLQRRPDLIIVRDALFLGLNLKKEIPTVLILKEDEPIIRRNAFTKPLNSPDSNRISAKVCTSGQFESSLEEISQELQKVFLERDLMEPFDRLKKACEDVHARKVGDS